MFLETQFPIHPPANVEEAVDEGLDSRVLDTHMRDSDWDPDPEIWLLPDLTVAEYGDWTSGWKILCLSLLLLFK